MPKILHFADSRIDMANYGRQDPETGLPLRVMDFLKSLDEIVDTAISEPVDCVIFAGDAYKNRDPAPTFQREWGKRKPWKYRLHNKRQKRRVIKSLFRSTDKSPATKGGSFSEYDKNNLPLINVGFPRSWCRLGAINLI